MTYMHTDALGKSICVDDYVAFPQANQLMIGKVAKLSNKMLIIEAVMKKRVNRYGERVETYRKYPKDSVVVDKSAGLTVYIMRNS